MNEEIVDKYCKKTNEDKNKPTIINKAFVYSFFIFSLVVTFLGVYGAYSIGVHGNSPFRDSAGLAIIMYFWVYIILGLLWVFLIGFSFLIGFISKHLGVKEISNKKTQISLFFVSIVCPIIFPIFINPFICNIGQMQYTQKQREIEHEIYNRNQLYKNKPVPVKEYYIERITPNGIEKSERRHPNSR